MAMAVFMMSVGCTSYSQLPQLSDLPIRNPLRSGPRFKVGPLPELSIQSQASPKVVKQWSSKLAFLSEGLSLYPKILPAVDEQFIYQANHRGQLVALNKKTGKKYWQLKTSYAISAGPTIIEDSLLVATQDAKIVSLNKNTGVVQWVVDVSSEALAPPQGNKKIVIVNTVDGKVTALNAKNGQLLWTYDGIIPSLMLRGATSPLLVDDIILSGFASGKLVALYADSGMLAWDKIIASPKGRGDLHRMVDIRADLMMDEGAVFVAAFQGNLTKIDLSTGETKWQREISVYHTLAMDKNAIYVTDANYHLRALNKVTGETLWEQENLAERYISAPTVMGDSILVGDRGGYIHWLNKDTGQIKARYLVGNKIVSDLIVDEDMILVSTQNGRLSAFKVIS